MQRRTNGQSVVEFTLTLGIVLLLIFGAIDAIQIMMAQYTVAQATRAAAHQAALIGGSDGSDGPLDQAQGSVAAVARLVLDSGLGTSAAHATIVVTCPAPCRRYSPVTVRITYLDEVWAPIGPFRHVRADSSSTRAAEQDQQP